MFRFHSSVSRSFRRIPVLPAWPSSRRRGNRGKPLKLVGRLGLRSSSFALKTHFNGGSKGLSQQNGWGAFRPQTSRGSSKAIKTISRRRRSTGQKRGGDFARITNSPSWTGGGCRWSKKKLARTSDALSNGTYPDLRRDWDGVTSPVPRVAGC